MTAFLITTGGEDIAIDDPDLTVHVGAGWAVFSTEDGVQLAIPTADVRLIQRVEEPAGPATDVIGQ